HYDPGTALGEKFDVCPPEPAACASHDRDLPLQRNSFGHLALLRGGPQNLGTRDRQVRAARDHRGQLVFRNSGPSLKLNFCPIQRSACVSTVRPTYSAQEVREEGRKRFRSRLKTYAAGATTVVSAATVSCSELGRPDGYQNPVLSFILSGAVHGLRHIS